MEKAIKYIVSIIGILALIALGALILPNLLGDSGETPPDDIPAPLAEAPPPSPSPDPELAVRDLVGRFGSALKDVSLAAPGDVLRNTIEEYYSPYVSPQLLSQWLDDPDSAPGRMVSSPWPDRIHIRTVSALSGTGYEVKGEIIEVTSAEAGTDRAAARRPIALRVAQVKGDWRITALELGEYEDLAQTVYTNDRYGFRLSLPNTWEDFSIIEDTWAGFSGEGEEADETGPVIAIRHPQWAADTPRQDIPVMVFTVGQWEGLQAGALTVGAAPVGPRELGRNEQYVFALPPRYNFEYLPGYEEVEQILAGDPLAAIEPGAGEPKERSRQST